MADFILRDSQPQIVNWICEIKRCGVWAAMGSGKTGATLCALDNLSTVEDVFPALVLAPLRVANSTWPNEVAAWDNFNHLRTSPISARRNPLTSATAKERLAALKVPADVYTLPYGSLAWLVEVLGHKWPFRTVIADEWPRLKSFRLRQGGANARALGKVAHTHVERFIGLTGTPSPNGLQDLWGPLWFVDKGERLGRTKSAFDMRWFRTGFDGFSQQPMPHAQAEIEALLRDVCVTVEGPTVDEPVVSPVYVDLDPKSRELYKSMEKHFFAELESGGIEAVNAGVKSGKLRQIAAGFLYDSEKEWHPIHSLKLEALDSIVEEANGAPVLVQYDFIPDKERILKHFKQAVFLDADPKTEDRWRAGEIQMLVAHGASAGHGLNLQDGGNILARYSYGWGLEGYMQILERIGPRRQKQSGYNRPVFDYPIICRDSIDEVVIERHKSKRSVQDLLLAAMTRHKKEMT